MNPSFEESDVVLTSYLYKKKLKKSALASSAWKFRFCVLRNSGRLFYYPNPAVRVGPLCVVQVTTLTSTCPVYHTTGLHGHLRRPGDQRNWR